MLLNDNQSILKFSIIIPVYNAEKYLERCLTSLFAQDLKPEEYEIIAVNDGSCDSSEQILQQMALKHTHLKWVTTENHGVSEARNLGCKMAKGNYLLFVDADDYVQPNLLQQIYDILEHERLDVLVMDYTYWDEKNQSHLFSDANKCMELATNVMTGKEFMQKCLPQVVWCSAYRTTFWRENKLAYLPIRHEDEEILPRIFYLAERVSFHKVNFYSYVRNPDSFMMNYDVRACRNLIQAMQSVDCFRKESVNEESMDVFFRNLISSRLLSAVILGVRGGLSHADLLEVVLEMKKCGLSPLPKGKGGFHKFLYTYLPSWFVTYYRLKKRK